MHLAVPGVVAYILHIQRALNQGGVDRACLSPAFHRELADWKVLALQAASRTTHLAKNFRQGHTHLGFCDASGLEAEGVWLNLGGTGNNLVRLHPWPADVTAELVFSTNPHDTITNSDLGIDALVLKEATLLESVPKACMSAPRLGSDNTLTVSWSTCKALVINQVIADLLCICALHSRKIVLDPTIFYHPGQENCMADDASLLFYLSDTAFLTHMYVVYP